MPCSLMWLRTWLRWCMWSSKDAELHKTSSRYVAQHSSHIPSSTPSIHLWKAAGAFVRPNGIRIHSHNPHGVLKAVRCLDSWLTNPWWYALPWSRMENQVLPCKLSRRSWIRGNGWQSGTVFQFTLLKSHTVSDSGPFFGHKPLGRNKKTQICGSNLCLGDSAHTPSPPYTRAWVWNYSNFEPGCRPQYWSWAVGWVYSLCLPLLLQTHQIPQKASGTQPAAVADQDGLNWQEDATFVVWVTLLSCWFSHWCRWLGEPERCTRVCHCLTLLAAGKIIIIVPMSF